MTHFLRHLLQTHNAIVRTRMSGEKAIESAGIPFPSEMVHWLVVNALGGTAGGAFPVRIPDGIREATIRPTGVVLYGGTP